MPKNRAIHKLSYADPVIGRPPSPLTRRWFILLAFALVVLLRVITYGGSAWVLLLTDLILEGCHLAFWLAAATLAGWFVIDRVGLVRPTVAKSLLLCTAAAIGLGLVGLLTLGLGLLGWLNRVSAVAMLVVIAVPQLIQLRHARPNVRAWLQGSAPAGWVALIAAPFVAIALTGAMLPPGLLWKNADDPHPYDVLEYHLQVPREWYEAGRITPLQHNAFSYFPMGAEMHDLLAMHLRGGPWEGMYLAQLMSATFMGLALVGVYGVCRTIRRTRGNDDRAVPMLAAVLAAVVPWTTLLAPVAYVEGAMLLFATLSIGWALVAFGSAEGRVRRMAVAGVLAGLACGVKYTAVPMVLLAVPAALLVWLFTGVPDKRRAILSLGVYVAAGVLTFSPWLVRNAAWAGGNPVFPEAMRLLGHAHFSPDQVDRWEQAHSPRPDQRSLPARLHAGWDQVAADWRYGLVVLPLALVCAGFAWRRPEARVLLAILLIAAGIWLFATHLQSRFFVLAIPACAMLVGLAPQWRRTWIGLAVVVIIAAVPSYGWLNAQLLPFLGPFGVTDFKDAMPPAYVKLADEGRDIALVGQGQVFWYQIPMTRLTYRTVFDVDATGTADPLSPWLGPTPKPGQWLLVYPSELERFSKTYAHIPSPPADLLGQPEPVVVPPPGVK